MVVLREEISGAVAARVTNKKGNDEAVEAQLERDLEQWGARAEMAWKSDNEPAILELIRGAG